MEYGQGLPCYSQVNHTLYSLQQKVESRYEVGGPVQPLHPVAQGLANVAPDTPLAF